MEIKCCLCGVLMTRNTKDISKGQPTFNNPSPLGKNIGDVCCDSCDTTKVTPARIKQIEEWQIDKNAKK
jgi:hypothetical protein